MAQRAPSVGKSFHESFSLFLRHFPVLAGLYVGASVLSIIINYLFPAIRNFKNLASTISDYTLFYRYIVNLASSFGTSWFLSLLVTTFVTALFIQYASAIYLKESVSWKKFAIKSLKKLVLILLAYCLMAAVFILGYIGFAIVIVIFAFIPVIGVFFVFIGVAALIVFYIIFIVKSSFAVYCIVLEDCNPISAFIRSFSLTTGFSGRIFLFYAIYCLIVILLYFTLYALITSLLSQNIAIGLISLFISGAYVFFQSWLETSKITVFFQIKQFRENFGLEKLVNAFNEPEQTATENGISGN